MASRSSLPCVTEGVGGSCGGMVGGGGSGGSRMSDRSSTSNRACGSEERHEGGSTSGYGCSGVMVVRSSVSDRACVTGGGRGHSGGMRWSTASSNSRLSCINGKYTYSSGERWFSSGCRTIRRKGLPQSYKKK